MHYSRLLCDQFGQPISEERLRAFVTDVLSDTAAVGPARPADVVLEFKHVCRCACLMHRHLLRASLEQHVLSLLA